MHRCAAKCCDDPSSSLERVHGCIDSCTGPLNQANNYVQVINIYNFMKHISFLTDVFTKDGTVGGMAEQSTGA